MKIINVKSTIKVLILLIAAAHFTVTATLAADNNGPELPAVCSHIEVDSDQNVAFHAYAIGVQIYRWTGSTWELKAPDAVLYSDPNYRGKIGTHYAGPIWETNSGSAVTGTRMDGCDVDPDNSIQWLLLQTAYTEGAGVFSKVTYIQRVNTSGGLKPATPGIITGEEKRIPYTAEYYFYRGGG